jgi:starch synthase (maltosyl-transferring)
MGRSDASPSSTPPAATEGAPRPRSLGSTVAAAPVRSAEGLPPSRVAIEAVEPEIDAGRFPAKRVVGDRVEVRADIFTEGHDRISGAVRHRASGDSWTEIRMEGLGNDRFRAEFEVSRLGIHEFEIEAWVDVFGSWRHGLDRKLDAGVGVQSELLEGAALVAETAERAEAAGNRGDAAFLRERARQLASTLPEPERARVALSDALLEAMTRHPDRTDSAHHPRTLRVRVERARAVDGAWYEFFPRSAASEPGRHGTFRDAEARLVYAAEMGFDVVYLPPVHPIGETHRKGRNNAPTGAPGAPGSPWAIGARAGGHTAIHPELGTIDDFDRFVARARELEIEIALDLAFQCSPDHPWVREHPSWFRHRPDGTIQYAENPPKKYQDIYPLDFGSGDWRSLWDELLRVVLFWVDHGVKIFRVDNPHTKPLAFWEWLIEETLTRHPDVVFLAEAFTRPSVLRHLAKLGFSQSYSYFTWRNTKEELTSYFVELTQTETREYLRANLFANTPDILPEFLQTGSRSAFQIRLALAATLAGNYGIYGPTFELCVSDALPGREEYRDSEKYEIRQWDLESPQSLRAFITRINRIRRENPPLRTHGPVRFLPIDNPQMIAYLRTGPEGTPAVLVIVNLDPNYVQSGFVEIPLLDLGLEPERPYQMHDLVSESRFLWRGVRNYVQLDPQVSPAHVFRLRRHVRTERDFDYYL